MKIALPSLSWVRWPWSERSKSRWNGMHMVENLDVFLDKPLGGIHVFGGKDFEPGPSLGSSSTRHPHPVEPIVDRRVGDLESSLPATSSVQGRSTPRNGATSDDSSLRELESASLWRVQAVHPDRRSDERALHPIASLPTHPCRKRSLSAPGTLSSLEVSSEVLRKSTSTSQLSSTRTRSTHLSPYRDTLEGDPRIFSTATITITSSDNTHIGSGRKGNDRGKLTWPQELYMMCAKMIGVSMLAMPKTFAELGVLGAVVFVVVGAVLSFIGARAIWEFKMAHPHVRNMAELLETLFSPWGQSMSRFGYWLGLILTTVFNLGVMAVHIKVASTIIEKAIDGPHAFGDWSSSTISSLIVALICVLVCLVPNEYITRCGRLSLFLTIAFVITFFVGLRLPGFGLAELSPETLANAGNTGQHIHMLYNTEATWGGQFDAVLRINFAFLIHTSVPTLVSQMEKPRDFPKPLAINFTFLSSFLILFGGVTCALVTRQHLEEMPWNMVAGGFGTACALLAVVPCVLQGLVYGIVNTQPAVHRLSEIKNLAQRPRSLFSGKFLILLGFWLVAWVLACIVPKFGNLLAIIGGIFGCIYGTTLPAVLTLVRLVQDSKGKSLSHFVRSRSSLRVTTIIILMACAVLLAAATCSPIKSFMLEIAQTMFRPFVYSKESTAIEEIPSPTSTTVDDPPPTPMSTAYLATETDADSYAI